MWNDKAMYFGGAHAVSRISGILRAKGDARRSGESFLI